MQHLVLRMRTKIDTWPPTIAGGTPVCTRASVAILAMSHVATQKDIERVVLFILVQVAVMSDERLWSYGFER